MRRVIVALLACLIAAGCTPIHHGLFVNGSDELLLVSLYTERQRDGATNRAGDRRLFREFAVSPGGAYRAQLIPRGPVVLRDAAGVAVSRRTCLKIEPTSGFRSDPHRAGGTIPRMYLLVGNGIYPVAEQFRRDWRQHVDAIVGTPVAWQRCDLEEERAIREYERSVR